MWETGTRYRRRAYTRLTYRDRVQRLLHILSYGRDGGRMIRHFVFDPVINDHC